MKPKFVTEHAYSIIFFSSLTCLVNRRFLSIDQLLLVLGENFLHVAFLHFFSELLHGEHDVFRSDLTGLVRVELVEDDLEARFRQKALPVDRGSQKFTVVYDLVAVKVQLGDHFLNFCFAHATVLALLLLLHDELQFLNVDHSRPVQVNGLELGSQVAYLVLRGHLDD